jgi:transcriptional regulator with XRE-family HTH domain
MTQTTAMSDFTAVLTKYMSDRSIPSFRALSKESGLSRSAIDRLRRGQVLQMQVNTLLKLARFLQLDLELLVRSLSPMTDSPMTDSVMTDSPMTDSVMADVQPTDVSRPVGDSGGDPGGDPVKNPPVISEEMFQRSALHQLEPWLLQWSAVATAAQNNPQMSAANLLPLLRPIDLMLAEWGVTKIGQVGEELEYDPTEHQLMDPEEPVQVGDRVRVRFSGYRYKGSLLHRAKVSIPGVHH